MSPSDDPAEHRKARFAGVTAGRHACIMVAKDSDEALAETYAIGIAEGAFDYLAATFGDEKAKHVIDAFYFRYVERDRKAVEQP